MGSSTRKKVKHSKTGKQLWSLILVGDCVEFRPSLPEWFQSMCKINFDQQAVWRFLAHNSLLALLNYFHMSVYFLSLSHECIDTFTLTYIQYYMHQMSKNQIWIKPKMGSIQSMNMYISIICSKYAESDEVGSTNLCSFSDGENPPILYGVGDYNLITLHFTVANPLVYESGGNLASSCGGEKDIDGIKNINVRNVLSS